MNRVGQPTPCWPSLPLYVLAALALLSFAGQPALAQWTTNGTNISNTNSGNVGVGTDAPLSKLHSTGIVTAGPLDGDVYRLFGLSNANFRWALTHSPGGSFGIAQRGDAWADEGTHLTIARGGNVGFGTTSPVSLLNLVGPNAALTFGTPGASDASAFSLTVADSGGNTNGGNGRSLVVRAGNSDNAAGRAGGDLVLNPGSPTAPATSHGRVLLATAGGSVGVGTTAPIGSLNVPAGVVVIGQNYSAGATLSVGRADANYPGIVSATNYSDGAKPVYRARAFSAASLSGEGIYNFLGQRDDTTRTFSADYLGNGYFAGSLNAVGGLCIAGDCKTSWSQVGASQWTNAGANIHYAAGNVGVGTNAPTSTLTVSSDTNVSPVMVTGTNPNVVGLILNNSAAGSKAWGLQVTGPANGHGAPNGSLVFRQATDNTNPLVVSPTGNVGVGTATPGARLDVNGNVNVSGSINAKYQDVAEWVPSAQRLAAGTVVVLDADRVNHVVASTKSYDTRVAGVVSARPGISLGEAGEGKLLVATTGRVRVRVDATRGPIKVGDLLVTSDREGVAMASVAVEVGGVQMHRPGTVVGKALEPLAGGVGEILVLLSLQ